MGIYNKILHLVIASLAPFTGLLAVDKCTVHSFTVVSLVNFVFAKVPTRMHTVLWNLPKVFTECTFLLVSGPANTLNVKLII